MKKFIIMTASIILLVAALKTDGEPRLTFASVKGNQTEKLNTNPVIPVTITAYSPSEEECDDDPYTTAFQKPVKEGTIAISRDLENEFGWRLGDKIFIPGLGTFEVWDRMHPRWKKRVDIFFSDSEKAVSFGIKQARATRIGKHIIRKGA